MDITGRVFVVTGGGNGIGREVVLALLARGGTVVALDVSDDGLAETASLASAGDQLATRTIDITDRAAVLALPEELLAEHGRVDALVNVAGVIQPFVPIAQLDFDQVERVMDINFWGTVNTCKAFLPHLEQLEQSALVNVSSMGGLVPVPGQSAYGASKAAVKLFTEGLIAEHQDAQPVVTVVFPGGIATNIAENSGVEGPAMSEEAAAKATGSLTTPQDAATQIVQAIELGRQRVLIGSDARALDRLGRLMPLRAIRMVAAKMRELLG